MADCATVVSPALNRRSGRWADRLSQTLRNIQLPWQDHSIRFGATQMQQLEDLHNQISDADHCRDQSKNKYKRHQFQTGLTTKRQ
jgi:hypothetical protein